MSKTQQKLGFTLIELMVVMAIIGIVMTLVLPNMGALMGSESRAQAVNLVDAKLRVARSLAIRHRAYVGVHFQEHYQNSGEIWCAIMIATTDSTLGRAVDDFSSEPSACATPYQDSSLLDEDEMSRFSGLKYLNNNTTFAARFRAGASGEDPAWRLMPGSTPARLPGVWRVGPVCSDLGNNYGELVKPNSDFRKRSSFTSFTVVFDPEGKTLHYIPQSPWNFMVVGFPGSRDAAEKGEFYTDFIFDEEPEFSDQRIWTVPVISDTIVNALCVYNGREFDDMAPGDQDDYLNDNAAFLVVNPMMGGLIRSAVE